MTIRQQRRAPCRTEELWHCVGKLKETPTTAL